MATQRRPHREEQCLTHPRHDRLLQQAVARSATTEHPFDPLTDPGMSHHHRVDGVARDVTSLEVESSRRRSCATPCRVAVTRNDVRGCSKHLRRRNIGRGQRVKAPLHMKGTFKIIKGQLRKKVKGRQFLDDDAVKGAEQSLLSG